MVEEHLLEVLDIKEALSRKWAILGVTEYGQYILEQAGPRRLALACLHVGDMNLVKSYINDLRLEDLPEMLVCKDYVLRQAALRTFDLICQYN